jgi:hypothetical protein
LAAHLQNDSIGEPNKMIAVNGDLMSDQSFLEWVKGKNYLLWQTGTKERFRLKIDRSDYLVTGLHKKVRKGLNIATAHGYYELEPVLAEKWDPLTIEEFGALKPGDRVHVLQRCGMIQECVLKGFGLGMGDRERPLIPSQESRKNYLLRTGIIFINPKGQRDVHRENLATPNKRGTAGPFQWR